MEWLFVVGIGAVILFGFSSSNSKSPTRNNDVDYPMSTHHDFLAEPDMLDSSSSVMGSSDDYSPSQSSSSLFDDDSGCGHSSINPANGLPMVGCIDIEGNPYGTSSDHHWNDDTFTSIDTWHRDD